MRFGSDKTLREKIVTKTEEAIFAPAQLSTNLSEGSYDRLLVRKGDDGILKAIESSFKAGYSYHTSKIKLLKMLDVDLNNPEQVRENLKKFNFADHVLLDLAFADVEIDGKEYTAVTMKNYAELPEKKN